VLLAEVCCNNSYILVGTKTTPAVEATKTTSALEATKLNLEESAKCEIFLKKCFNKEEVK